MVEQPVEANAVHLTAAGKAKAASKKQDQASKSKMTIEEVDATVVTSNKPEQQPATVEIVERVPVVEPLIVKEEATLLYEGEIFTPG